MDKDSLIIYYIPPRTLRSSNAGIVEVLSYSRKKIGDEEHTTTILVRLKK